MPQRGRACQCLHSRSPTSSFETRTQWYSLGSAIIRSTRLRFDSSTSARRRDLGLRLADANHQRVADPLEVGGAEHARAARGADAPVDAPARKGRRPKLAELAFEPGDLAPQLVADEALVVLVVTSRASSTAFVNSKSCCASSSGMTSSTWQV